MQLFYTYVKILVAVAVTWSNSANALESESGTLEITEVVSNLDQPWAVGFLPNGALLITERDGRLLHVLNGRRTEVRGLPEIAAVGQGGLLDLLIPRDFSRTREIYLTYSKPQGSGAGTSVARGLLSPDGRRLTAVRTIFEMTPGSTSGRHFGSRIVEGPRGHLFVTIGDRAVRPSAQDLSNENGSVIRINRDGSFPETNPFADAPNAKAAIWSLGHRNAQGAAFDADGNLLIVEHGAQGGDEINLIEKGHNYGWPVISYGRHYSGGKIGEGTAKPGMQQPEYFWDPSIAPSGMMIYSGRLWPEWRGDIFIGSLKFDYISRLRGSPLREVEQLKSRETIRVRDIREGPNGAIWFLSVGQGALYRIRPAN